MGDSELFDSNKVIKVHCISLIYKYFYLAVYGFWLIILSGKCSLFFGVLIYIVIRTVQLINLRYVPLNNPHGVLLITSVW